MKKLILPCIVALLACNNTNTTHQADPVAVIVKDTTNEYFDTTAMNILSTTERVEGWQLLFNGKDLAGWHLYQHKTGGAWSVDSGMLHCKGSKDFKAERADLTTDSTYDNFELFLEWKIAAQGNSGIIYLASEEFPAPFLSGPEYQLIDDNNFPEKLEEWQKTGGNYGMSAPLVNATRPVGVWNHARIVVVNGHVEHWLNGQKTADYVIGSKEWRAEKEQGKWKMDKGYGVTKRGYIDLQDHGSEVWFRNIKIKRLS